MGVSRVLHPSELRRRLNSRRLDRALKSARGVIHVGANTGQEREVYDRHGLAVFWVEAIPSVFADLKLNVAGLPRQRCANALVTDEDGREFAFHIAGNNGASSSILDLADHRDIWPDVSYVEDIKLVSVTLPTLLRLEGVEATQYDVLMLDTQGSELLVLKGAAPLLHGFQYIRTEAADFESYVGCARREEITDFLAGYGFKEWAVAPFAERRNGGGQYYDILYRRVSRPGH
jgi:FkbM family methyltransferase